MDHDYLEPVARLLTLGETDFGEWRTYSGLGISAAHIPDLIGMAGDLRLEERDTDDPAVYAPVHAWRALAELKAPQVMPVMIDRLDRCTRESWDDYVVEDFSQVASAVGRPALPFLFDYLRRPDRYGPNLWTAVDGTVAVARADPEVTGEVVAALRAHLEAWPTNAAEFNGGLISALVRLQDQEAMPLIRAAIEADAVDTMICGSLEHVEYDLGLRDLPPEPGGRAVDDRHPYRPEPPGELARPGTKSDGRGQANAKQRARARRKQAKVAKRRNRRK